MSGGPPEGVAIVGLFGRFPGAPDLETFWRNLRDGVESLTSFSDEQLLAAGLRPEEVADPARVRIGRTLEGIDEFDAAFFGYAPHEAQLMDPQQRLFLEGAWAALEDAGYTAERYGGLVAVYAGMGLNTYLLNNLAPARGTRLAADDLVAQLGNEKDFVTTRISFHLDLGGPSFAVQCGCSSSLVAVAQAFQALSSHQCDMALAGGASISVPQDQGYVHVQDGILSPDGRCRPFDARGQGTCFGNGLGIVVLKRLEDALADGDRIRAVIRGAAVNNDGARKLGYTAPSVERQAQVIATAQALAQVDPRTISYVEAHGTATALGDPVEVAALTAAFGAEAAAGRACALGSVKGNIGHLDAASGVAGLIKTVLALEHRQIPPSLHFERPNPRIDFEGSPFFVNTALCDWERNGRPRRAGVSSFGIGGTNAHVVLEEAPEPPAPSPGLRSHQVLVLSARSPAALDAAAERLAAHLERNPDLALADVAWTLQVGRRAFEHRRALVCADLESAVRGLREPRPATMAGQGIAFVFAGAEPPRSGAARELYELEPGFRRPFDDCCQRLERHLGLDLRGLLLSETGAGPSELQRVGPAARFAVEHALAQLWKEWGLAPAVAVGRGAGALVAAGLAGVLHPDGAELLAAASGEGPEAFAAALKRVPLRPLLLPLVSEVTGARLSPQEAMSPRYWMRRLEQPDRLEQALEQLRGEHRTLLRIGTGEPGRDAAENLARALADAWAAGAEVDWTAYGREARARRVPLPTYPFERTRHWFTPDVGGERPAPGGRSSDPSRWFHLPSWSLAPPLTDSSDGTPRPPARWLVVVDGRGYWEGLLGSLRERNQEVVAVRQGERFEELGPGSFALDLASREDCGALARALGGAPGETHVVHVWPAAPDEVEDQAPGATATGATSAMAEVRRGLSALYLLADALGAGAVTVVSAGGVQVAGEPLRPATAALLGAARVLPQDRLGLRVRCVDVGAARGERAERELVERLLLELEQRDLDASTGALVALRGRQRWVPRYEPVALADPGPGPLRERGVYLITGGLGGIGRTLAEFLAAEVRARLVLVGRSVPLDRDERPELGWLSELERRGAEVLLAAADASDRDSMARVVARARQAFGRLDGVIHAAGVPGAGPRQGEGEPPSDAALAAKVAGTLVLAEVCGEEPDFVVLCSALATVLGGLGQADYCAANAFMDALATRRLGRAPRFVSIGWDTWSEVGMAVEAELPEQLRTRQHAILAEGLTRQEGVEVFRRALASPHPHVLVSTRPLASRLEDLAAAARASARADTAADPRADGAAPGARGSLEEIERTVAHLWTTLLGVETAASQDNFFAQGGNSLLATQMLGGVLRHYPGSEISLRRFFEDPTLGGLARAIAAASAGPAAKAAEPAADGLRQRLLAAAPEERPVLLHDYVAREVAEALGVPAAELEGPGGLEAHDETLVAAHLTWALRRDLGLPLYPHEIRARRSVGELAQYVGLELLRLAERAGERPAVALDVSDPHSLGRATQYVAPRSAGTPAARNPPMAFVLSAPRSGSTLLRVMLSAHPELFCPPELFLLDNDTMRAWERDPFSEFYRDGLVRAFMAHGGVDFAAAQELVRGLVEADTPVQEVYRQLQADGRLLVDKTPTYGLSRATLERAEALFERPRHVVLVRHPLAVIDSIVQNRLDRVRRAVGDPHALAERYWVQTYRNLAELRERVGPGRGHLVRYEDLVRSPEAVLRDLCAFLGVGFDAAVLDPYRCGRMLGGPGDPNFFQRGAIDASLADAWRNATLPRPLGDACTELARAFGYELP